MSASSASPSSSRPPSPSADAPASNYVDVHAILEPTFSPAAHANELVLATNNVDDPPPLDLSTPLSRVLFDSQEIDSRIEAICSRHAVELLSLTIKKKEASDRIINTVDAQLKSLNESYAELEKEVIVRHAVADEVASVVTRVWEALRLAKAASRCLDLARQLEVQAAEVGRERRQQQQQQQQRPQPQRSSMEQQTPGEQRSSVDLARGVVDAGKNKGEDDDNHHALVRCAHTILSLRDVLENAEPGQEGHGLDKVDAVQAITQGIIASNESKVREASKRIIREFSFSASTTFAQGEAMRSRTTSALNTLYLLSPTLGVRADRWSPELLLQTLEDYVRTAVQSSVAGLARGLGQLPTLEKVLGEVVGRCQNVVALEAVLEATRPPIHPILTPYLVPPPPPPPEDGSEPEVVHLFVPPPNLLQPLLARLETGSLPSFFWRTMAGSLSTRVQEITTRGGVAARTLRSNKTSVGDAIRDAVAKGSAMPSSLPTAPGRGKQRPREEKKWDMEMAVMVGSVVNNLGGR